MKAETPDTAIFAVLCHAPAAGYEEHPAEGILEMLSLSSKPCPSHMSHVKDLPISPSAFLQLLVNGSSTCSFLGSLPQEAQPVDQAQALRSDK